MTTPPKLGRRPKLTPDDVAEIQRMYSVKDKPWTVPQIAKSFGVSVALVHKVLNPATKTMPPQLTAKQLEYLEPEDGPARTCEGCGEPMLRATMANVEKVKARAAECRDPDDGYTFGVSTTGTLRRMRLALTCCYVCTQPKLAGTGHTSRCILANLGSLLERPEPEPNDDLQIELGRRLQAAVISYQLGLSGVDYTLKRLPEGKCAPGYGELGRELLRQLVDNVGKALKSKPERVQ